MNRKRTTSIVVLAALLMAQALPARAGAMLCPMKTEARVQVACTGCDAKDPAASGGLLRSRGCCHMKQGEAFDATPVVLSASRRALSSEPQILLAEPVPLLASGSPDGLVRALAWSAPPGVSLLSSSSRTTVLRN
jgi:hypothetical protein